MTKQIGKTRWWRVVAPFAAISMIVAACGNGGETTAASAQASASTAAGESAAASTGGGGGTLDSYALGIFQDVTTDNAWASLDTSGNTVWNAYFLTPTQAGAYTTAMPGIEYVPDLADADLAPVTQDGDKWVGSWHLRPDLKWSDGDPITANDWAYTWQTAVDCKLLGPWQDFADAVGVTAGDGIVESVVATDDSTVTVTFTSEPGLATWGPGTNITNMPIMPEHFWKAVSDKALAGSDCKTELLAASGKDAPASGATVFSDRQAGSFGSTKANPEYYDEGVEKTSGGVTWTEGPFAENFQFTLYGGQEAAVLALSKGEVDLLLNPLGMQRGFQETVEGNADLKAIVNPTNGYRFMAFNEGRAPMSDAHFRDALTALIDREFVTGNLLQGVAFPLWVLLPEGNTNWYDKPIADQIKQEYGFVGLSTDERRTAAIKLLKDGNYTWDAAPGWYDEDGKYVGDEPGDGLAWTPGDGIRGPEGDLIGTLRLIHPTAAYDPLRATFGGYIAGVAGDVGIDLVSVPTDFNKIIDIVFADDGVNYTSDFDMFILGYSLGSAALPDFHGSFFATGGDSNNMQYSNPDFDEWNAKFAAATTTAEAYDAIWEMEQIIAKDKPHLPLFDTGILEFYNQSRVQYPFTDTLSGLQFLNGLQSTVTAK